MIRVELSKLLRRPRTWVTIALLAGLPVVVGIFVKASGLAPRPGEGPALLSEVLENGLLFPAAALAIILPLFLPIAVSVIGGDTVAGEASNGTLRYLLTRPVGRSRLLTAKLVTIVTFIFLAVIVVALVALAAGESWRLLFVVGGVATELTLTGRYKFDPERRRTIEAALAPDDLESLKDASYERVREAEWKARCLAHEKSVCVGCWNHKSEIGAQAGGTAQ